MPEIGLRDGRPLLTFAVLAYNQEPFIRDAIEGALSQTYSPLEIVLSDDCSSDGTFAVMEQMASSYKGPHRVIVNRNPSNFGLGGHVNRIMELSTGELVVIAEGDDISLPERTSLTYEAWEHSGRSMAAIYSDYLLIDESGTLRCNPGERTKEKNGSLFELQRADLREFMSTLTPMINGCTRVWPRRLFRQFGKLPTYLRAEDFVLCFRSLAYGGILHISRPLVKYRRHDKNLSFHTVDHVLDPKSYDEYDAKRSTSLLIRMTAMDTAIHDIRHLRQINKYDPSYLARVEGEARRVRALFALEREMILQGFPGRARIFFEALSRSGPRPTLRLAPQALPRRLYHKLRAVKLMLLRYLRMAPM